MRLIVTGGCGFLGSNLAADAIARGDEVTVFDNLRRTGAAATATAHRRRATGRAGARSGRPGAGRL